MTIEMDISTNTNLDYLMDQIRSNLSAPNENVMAKHTPRAHAWLLTTLSIYGDQFSVLIDLYRVFRERNCYVLLSFVIEYILQNHVNGIDKSSYLQEEFQLLCTNSSKSFNDETQFSYSHLHSLLSLPTREIISSLLIRKWYTELEKNLSSSTKSIESLNQCREKALACLSLSSLSSSIILQLITHTEENIGFNTKMTSLNILRCLFVQDLLPIVLENRQRLNIESHLCHKWLIYAIEFYLEYLIKSSKNNVIRLEGNPDRTYQCDNPIEKIENLINLAMSIQENFNWQQFIINQGNQTRSTNRRQKLLELRVLIDRAHSSIIRCPLECFIFCTSFPVYIQSTLNLSSLLVDDLYKDYIFLCSTSSIKTLITKQNQINNIELIENFYLFVECLSLLQESKNYSCLKLYQETIDKIHLNSNIDNYRRLLRLFYFYHHIQKSKIDKTNKSIQETNQNKPITIDDTPQSPTMQDESNADSNSIIHDSPLLASDIESLIQQLNDNTLESRLQICSLLLISNSPNQRHSTVSFGIDTLVYLHENQSLYNQQKNVLTISSDYCFIPRSYNIFFDYVMDIILQNLSPTLILIQFEKQRLSPTTFTYPENLLHSVSPGLLRYIYDQKLLGQILKYIQKTTKTERRWSSNSTNKRKLDDDDVQLNDEQFIEKIIQHVSNITQWTDEQRRYAIYTYMIDQRQTLLHSL